MKEKLIRLIKDQNFKEDGLYISTSVEDYVEKIYNYSTLIPYFVNGDIVGFISYYNNDVEKLDAFLTLILVSRKAQGQGIGKLLINTSINDLKKRGFKTYSLEVLKENNKAIHIYTTYGFRIFEEKANSFLMKKILL